MAQLATCDSHVVLEIAVTRRTPGCQGSRSILGADYAVAFLWGTESIVNSRLIKRTGWRAGEGHAFPVHDCTPHLLVAAFRTALETGDPTSYETLDPDLTIGIYPEMPFPFTASWCSLPSLEERRRHREGPGAARLSSGRLADDFFDIIVGIDTYTYTDEDGYGGPGPALIVSAYRDELDTFVSALEREILEAPVDSDRFLSAPGGLTSLAGDAGPA
jgi:hypothetical protein